MFSRLVRAGQGIYIGLESLLCTSASHTLQIWMHSSTMHRSTSRPGPRSAFTKSVRAPPTAPTLLGPYTCTPSHTKLLVIGSLGIYIDVYVYIYVAVSHWYDQKKISNVELPEYSYIYIYWYRKPFVHIRVPHLAGMDLHIYALYIWPIMALPIRPGP